MLQKIIPELAEAEFPSVGMSKAMREKDQARFEYLGSPRVTGDLLEEREKSKQENEEMAKTFTDSTKVTLKLFEAAASDLAL